MNPGQIHELAATARDAAHAGGQLLLEHRDKFSVREKGEFDFVTDADVASQRAIEALLAERFPDHQILGEESEKHERPKPDKVCWVIDPLDGTTNYLHQFPFYSVSIAAVLGDQVLAATVLDPLGERAFWAYHHGGAWMNEQRLSVSSAGSLAESLVSMSLPPQVQHDSPDVVDFLNVVPKCQAIRRTGSAALNLAFLAAGKIDAYWARQIHPWDVAAGVLLVQEAGGVVSSSSGGPFDLWHADLAAAASAGVHSELVAELSTGGS